MTLRLTKPMTRCLPLARRAWSHGVWLGDVFVMYKRPRSANITIN